MSDVKDLEYVFAALAKRGWDGGPDYACCMTCAKAELIPLQDAGTSSAWYTEQDREHARFDQDGNIGSPSGLTVTVLGDVEVVAGLLSKRFGRRVFGVFPDSAAAIGSVVLLRADRVMYLGVAP